MRNRGNKKLLSLKEILPQTLEWIKDPSPFLKDPLTPLEKIHRKWIEIVGPHLASKGWPLKIRGRRLFIGVPSSVWANEIDFLKISILERIQSDPEIRLSLEEIRFQIVTSRLGSSG